MWPFSSRPARRPLAARRGRPAYRPRLDVLEDRCLLSAGALDPTFGSGGLVTTVPSSAGNAEAMAIQSNGDIVVAGWAKDPRTGEQDFMVARYNLDGSLDTTFGNAGIALTPIGRLNSSAWALAIQPDGKIVAGGSSAYYGAKQQQYSEAALVRYNTDGTLDTTFGGSKTPGIALSTTAQPITCLALETNGEIATAGNKQVALFTSHGALDTTFGQGGVVSLNVYEVHAIAIQPTDGKIVAAGGVHGPSGNQLESLARLNTNGSLDSTFGSGGYVSQQFSPVTPVSSWTASYANSLLIQPDGKLVTVGSVMVTANANGRQDGLVLARFNTDGSLDGGFGSGGSVISTAIDGGGFEGAQAPVALQADGSLVVAGQKPNNQGDFVTSRYTASGQLDTTWGTNGVSDVSVNGSPHGMALEPNGTVVVAGAGGVNVPNGAACIFLARYLTSQPQISSFTANPNPVTVGSSVTLTASGITDGNPGVSITQVAFYLDSNRDGVLEPGTDQLLGYATQTSPGVWTFTFSTTGWAAGSYTLFAQAKDSYSVLGDPGALTLTVQ
jgi:uncharacterized delta-60 repeat protein